MDTDLRRQMFLGLMNEGILPASNLVGALSTQITEAEIDTYVEAFRTVLQRQQ